MLVILFNIQKRLIIDKSYVHTHPDKCRREPAAVVSTTTEPPGSVHHVRHFNYVTSFKPKFIRIQSNMVPQCFSKHRRTGVKYLKR